MKNEHLAPGTPVLVDGCPATVQQSFPEGSSSFLFPHCKLAFVDGEKNVAVAMSRIVPAVKPDGKRSAIDARRALPELTDFIDGVVQSAVEGSQR